MSKITEVPRIRSEDFTDEERPLGDKIAGPFNGLVDKLLIAFNRGINFDNLNMQLISVTVLTNGSSAVINPPTVKTSLLTKVAGVICINAINQTSVAPPASAPFVSFTPGTNNLTISNISGLTANEQWQLTLLVIGT